MTTQTAIATRSLAIDRSHSEAAFQVRHLLSKVRGRFTDFAGTIAFDSAQPQNSRVEVVIQAASIDTAEPDRDRHLRSADFFDAEHFPTLTFTSTSVTRKPSCSTLWTYSLRRPRTCESAWRKVNPSFHIR